MLNLKIPHAQAIALLEERIEAMKTIRATPDGPEYYDVVGWMSATHSAIDRVYGGEEIHPQEIRAIGLPACSCSAGRSGRMILEEYRAKLQDYIDEIRRFVSEEG